MNACLTSLIRTLRMSQQQHIPMHLPPPILMPSPIRIIIIIQVRIRLPSRIITRGLRCLLQAWMVIRAIISITIIIMMINSCDDDEGEDAECEHKLTTPKREGRHTHKDISKQIHIAYFRPTLFFVIIISIIILSIWYINLARA